MEKENAELKKKIESLLNELEASMRREEMLLNNHGRLGAIKQRLKETSFGKVAANPNSAVGKVIRLPRTIFRIAMHPSIINDIRQKNKSDTDNNVWKKEDGELKKVLVPVRFVMGEGIPRRINLVVEKMDAEMLKMGIELANKEGLPLRVVTYGESAQSVEYSKMVKNKEIPKAKEISFYSSVDQMEKNKLFELEVTNDDVFLTKIWSHNGEASREK